MNERTHRDEKANFSGERLRLLTDHVPVLISYLDKHEVFRFTNAAYEDWFDLEPGQICGRHLREVIGDDIYQGRLPYLTAVLRGEKVRFEAPSRHHRLGLRDTELTYIPDFDSEHNVRGFFVMVQDITERKIMADELEHLVTERTADLHQTIAALEAFSSSISHDLRAPIRTMKMLAECLLADFGEKLEPGARFYAERICSAADNSLRLVHDVLHVSKVTSSELKLRRINLDDIVLPIMQAHPEFHEPKAKAQVGTPLGVVLGNEAALIQCVSNLLSNAVKFVPPGITPHIRIWSEAKSESLRLLFLDNGVGIPKDDQHRIFQGANRLQPQYDGIGIGLSIVTRAVRKMGGTVGVTSQPGKGSCFWLELPIANNETSSVSDNDRQ